MEHEKIFGFFSKSSANHFCLESICVCLHNGALVAIKPCTSRLTLRERVGFVSSVIVDLSNY